MNQNVIAAGCRIMMRMKNGADAALVGTVFIISAFCSYNNRSLRLNSIDTTSLRTVHNFLVNEIHCAQSILQRSQRDFIRFPFQHSLAIIADDND